ncbi:MAG: tetratricopeptide repeat protein [Planctomycetaceae bacterium]
MHPRTSLLPATVAFVLGATAVWAASNPTRPQARVAVTCGGPGAQSAAALGRAWAAYLAGDLPAALAAYRAAADAAPRAVTPLLGVMFCEAARGDAAASHAAARAVLERDPANPQARRHLSIAAYDRGDYGAAEAGCREMLAAHPEDVEAISLLGWCLLRQARPDEARGCFHAVLAAVPGHVSAGAGLAAADATTAPVNGATP